MSFIDLLSTYHKTKICNHSYVTNNLHIRILPQSYNTEQYFIIMFVMYRLHMHPVCPTPTQNLPLHPILEEKGRAS